MPASVRAFASGETARRVCLGTSAKVTDAAFYYDMLWRHDSGNFCSHHCPGFIAPRQMLADPK
jgi:hypothetical protein